MKNNIIELGKKFYENGVVRYVFFGGCTTMVNLISFFLLRKAGIPLNPANLLSIILAILFAYIVNSRFVFHDHCENLLDQVSSFLKFIGARLFTMAVELGGVWLLVEKLGFWEMPGKAVTQVVVLILNYVFSKFLVFTHKEKSGERC